MTRISTVQRARQSVDLITQRQSEISDLQRQISTGKRVLKPSDDPSAAAQAERTRSEVARMEVESRMLGFAQLKLAQAESAVGEGNDLFQRARELLIGAKNDSNSPADRALYAKELSSIRDALLNLSNRSDGLGGFVFGGAGTRQPPFVQGANGIEYLADAGAQFTGSESTLTISVDGRNLFGTSSGAGVESVFDMIDNAVRVMENTGAAAVDTHTSISDTIDGIDAAIDRFSSTRASLGEQMATADRAAASLALGEELAAERLSDLTGVDMAEAISAMSAKNTELDAAMQTYVQISGLSLFNYIR
ncbi:MAG: flagellar hook-associated protein FlgL [Burkholderiaceae bacterium]